MVEVLLALILGVTLFRDWPVLRKRATVLWRRVRS